MKLKMIVGMWMLAQLSLLNGTASAQGQGTNGGEGTIVNGKLYLLDFVAGGIYDRGHELGFYDLIVKFRSDQTAEKRAMLEHWGSTFRKLPFNDELKEAIEAKLLSMKRPYRFALYAALDLYAWNMVPYNPKPSSTDGRTPLETDAPLTIALRKDRSILVGQDRFSKLDLFNQTGLVFHELFYALSTPFETSSGKFTQLSWLNQEVVATVFKDNGVNNDVNLSRFRYVHVSAPQTYTALYSFADWIGDESFSDWASYLSAKSYPNLAYVQVTYGAFIRLELVKKFDAILNGSYSEQWHFGLDAGNVDSLRSSADIFSDAIRTGVAPTGGYEAGLWDRLPGLCDNRNQGEIKVGALFHYLNYKFGAYVSDDGVHQYIKLERMKYTGTDSGFREVSATTTNCVTELQEQVRSTATEIATYVN